REGLEGRPRLGPAVLDREAGAVALQVRVGAIGAEPLPEVSVRRMSRLEVPTGIRVAEFDVEGVDDACVRDGEPDRRVGTPIRGAMPRPAWLHEEIAAAHGLLFALGDGRRLRALNHEIHRRAGMPMRL